MLKLIRLLKLARLLKLGRFFSGIEDATGINPSVFMLLQLLMKVVFIGHFLCCFWWFTGTLVSEGGSSWILSTGIQDADIET